MSSSVNLPFNPLADDSMDPNDPTSIMFKPPVKKDEPITTVTATGVPAAAGSTPTAAIATPTTIPLEDQVPVKSHATGKRHLNNVSKLI